MSVDRPYGATAVDRRLEAGGGSGLGLGFSWRASDWDTGVPGKWSVDKTLTLDPRVVYNAMGGVGRLALYI